MDKQFALSHEGLASGSAAEHRMQRQMLQCRRGRASARL